VPENYNQVWLKLLLTPKRYLSRTERQIKATVGLNGDKDVGKK